MAQQRLVVNDRKYRLFCVFPRLSPSTEAVGSVQVNQTRWRVKVPLVSIEIPAQTRLASSTIGKARFGVPTRRCADRPEDGPPSEEEALVVAFGRRTLLPVDNCLRAAADDPASDALVPS
jgi:hypothetical protein